VVQVLDRQTIGRIWTGSIRLWNDSAIQALNPAVAAKLPPVPITLGYGPEHPLAVIEVTKQAMSSFSDEFRDALAAANNSLARMAPAMEGRAFDAGSNATQRVSWLQVRISAACVSSSPHSPSYAYAHRRTPIA
jgi:ABC-type phosphate transport system substrate-binding protein